MKRGTSKPPKGKAQSRPDHSPEAVAAKIAKNRPPPIEQFDAGADAARLPRIGNPPKR